MPQLKLPKQIDARAMQVNISVTGDLRGALDKYAELYLECYGESITVEDLIPAIVSEFLASDGVFVPKRSPFVATQPGRQLAKDGEFNAFGEPVERFIQLKEVCRLVGVGKSMVYRMIQEGRFPAPYKPSPGAARWSEGEVIAWIASIKGGGH